MTTFPQVALAPTPVATSPQVPRTLVLTGHFPPDNGGVQRFTWELLRRLPSDRVVVVAPRRPGSEPLDRTLPFPVVRRRGYQLSVGLASIVAEHGCTAAWIPAAAPIGLFAPSLRRAGVERIVASTHGQELGWLRAAPTRGAMREIARSVDALTYLTGVARDALAGLPVPLVRLAGGVDTDTFRPGPATRSRPRVVTVGRLVRRKGQDALIEAWPTVLAAHPDAILTLIGSGPYEGHLRRLCARLGVSDRVELCTDLDEDAALSVLRSSDVLVTPSRDDRHGLQTEGLGLVTLEGSAVGLPVVVGRSGGSGDSVVDGVTGWLVEPTPGALAAPVVRLLGDPALARAMGALGRSWVRREWRWDVSAERLRRLLNDEKQEVVRRQDFQGGSWA